MIKTSRVFILLISLLFSGLTASATHIIGGEISYKCLGGNDYEFTIKIFRDCKPGNAQYDYPAFFTIFDADNNVVANPSVMPSDSFHIVPVNNNPCLHIPPDLCVDEAIYVFIVNLPPSPGGYTVVHQRCCRNNTILNIVSPGATGATYFTVLNDTTLQMCDNSPVYKDFPPIVICNNIPLVFDHSAVDDDGDKLIYELCETYSGASTTNSRPTVASLPPYSPVVFRTGYSYDDPMKGAPILAIDSLTGKLTVTPNTIGQFVVGICVSEYRDGVFLGTHMRDFQFNVVNCRPEALAVFPEEINSCNSDTIHFENLSEGDSLVFHWDFGIPEIETDTSNLFAPTYLYPGVGIYKVTLIARKMGSQCADTTFSLVYVYPPPTAGGDTTIFIGTTANLWASGGGTYRWTPSATLSSDTSSRPIASPTVTTTYTVTIVSPNGCIAIDSVVVFVLSGPDVKFYNAFSPNGDTKNDYFRPVAIGNFASASFRVYNRWGQLMFESQDAHTKGWDGKFKGKEQPVGVYVYYFEGVGAYDRRQFEMKGNVTLLR